MKTILTGQPQQDDAIFAGKYLWSSCITYIAITRRVMALFYQFRVHKSTVPMPE
jgi:hypothetical protein